jgi:hypothetical protein
MAARIKRDYGTAPCAYCGTVFQKKVARSRCCSRQCQSMLWFDESGQRKGPKPRLIVEGVTYGSN